MPTLNGTPTVNQASGVANWSFPHAFPSSGANRCATVRYWHWSGTAGQTVSTITIGGQACTFVSRQVTAGVELVVEIWRLVNPPTGVQTVAITMSGIVDEPGAAVSVYNDVDQTTPVGTPAGASSPAAGATATVNVTSASGELVTDIVTFYNVTQTGGPGQTQEWAQNNLSGHQSAAGSSEAGATSVTMSWTFAPPNSSSTNWAILAVPLRPPAAAATERHQTRRMRQAGQRF